MTVDSAAYPVAKAVGIHPSICNPTAEIIRFNAFSTLDPYLEVLDERDQVIALAHPDGVNGSGFTVEFEPGECVHLEYEWPQTQGRFNHPFTPLGPPAPAGTYRVHYQRTLSGVPSLEATSAPFQILPFPAVPAIGMEGVLLLLLGIAACAVRRLGTFH